MYDAKGTITFTESKFTDVLKDSFYEKAVLWATEQGIVKGVSDTLFCPDQPVKRSEVVTLLYRMDGSPSYDTSIGSIFKDVDDQKDGNQFYYGAMCWASQNGVVNGYEDQTFRPYAYCKRGEIVKLIYCNLGPYLSEPFNTPIT